MTRKKDAESFDFDATVRALAKALVKEQGLPQGLTAWPEPDELEPIGAQEREAIFNLATDHFLRHSIATPGPLDPPRCLFLNKPCKAFGLASAIYFALDSRRAATSEQHVLDLRRAGNEAAVALRHFLLAVRAYKDRCDQRHKGTWRIKHDHDHVCVKPLLVGVDAQTLLYQLRILDALVLAPQLPTDMRGKNRTGLLTLLQITLRDNGFSHAEILDLVDEGAGDAAAARLRKRLERAGATKKRKPSV